MRSSSLPLFLAGAVLIGGGFFSLSAQSALPSQLAKGRLLIAAQDLRDPNFAETVVLLLEYGSEGALGVIVNRPSEGTLADLLPEIEGTKGREETVFVGGPVLPAHLLLLVRRADAPPSSERVLDGIYYTGSREVLSELLVEGEKSERFRVFAGHAGWAPGQLEWEVKRGSWNIAPADAHEIFEGDPAKLWPELLRRSSGLLAALRSGEILPRSTAR